MLVFLVGDHLKFKSPIKASCKILTGHRRTVEEPVNSSLCQCRGAPLSSLREWNKINPQVLVLQLRYVNIYLHKWSGFHHKK